MWVGIRLWIVLPIPGARDAKPANVSHVGRPSDNPPSRPGWKVGGTFGHTSGLVGPEAERRPRQCCSAHWSYSAKVSTWSIPGAPLVGKNTGDRPGSPEREGLGHRPSGGQGGLRLREVNGTAALEGRC